MAICLAVFTSCHIRRGHNPEKVVTYMTGNVSNINVDGNLTVIYICSKTPKVVVSGLRDDVKRVKVTKTARGLMIRQEGKRKKRIKGERKSITIGNMFDSDDLVVYVCQPDIKGITLDGNMVFSSDDEFKGDSINVKARGNSVINLELEKVRVAKFEIRGNSVLNLEMEEVGLSDLVVNGNCVCNVEYDDCNRARVKHSGNSVVNLDGTVRNPLEYVADSDGSIVNNSVEVKKK